MKKLFIVMLSAVALLAFTVSAYALHGVKDMFEYTPQIVKSKKAQITLNGHIRIRGRMSDNTRDFRDTEADGSADDSFERYDQRARLGINATVSPNTMGHLELETGSSNTNASQTWGGQGGSGAQGIYGGGNDNSKNNSMTVRQAYIAHQGTDLGMLTGFKAGHMLLALGDGWFYNHSEYGDDAIIAWMQPQDGMEIALITIKLDEASNAISDDANAYVLSFAGAFGPADVSADVTYVDDNSFGGTTSLDNLSADLYNIGLRGKFAAGPVNINADVEIQTGTLDKYKTNGADMDLSGYAVIVGVDAKVGDAKVWGKVGYGSGDDIDTNDDYEGFINSLSTGQNFTYLYEQFTRTAAQGAPSTDPTKSSSYANSSETGIANTTFIGVGASANATPDLKVAGALYWLRASEKVANNTSTTTDNKDIGYELDGKLTYQIDTNLVWYAEAGYLWADDFYKNVTTDDTKAPDDAWSLRHGIILSF